MCLTADPGFVSSIPTRSHTLAEIDHEIISTAILLPSADSRCYRQTFLEMIPLIDNTIWAKSYEMILLKMYVLSNSLKRLSLQL